MVQRVLTSSPAKILFALSASAFVTLQVTLDLKDSVIIVSALANIITAFVLAVILAYKFNLPERLFEIKSIKYAVISSVTAAYAAFEIALSFYNKWIKENQIAAHGRIAQLRELMTASIFDLFLRVMLVITAIAVLIFLFTIIYAVISRLRGWSVKRIYNSMDKTERVYFAAAIFALGCMITYIYSKSTVFIDTSNAVYDVDSGSVRGYMSLYFGNTNPGWVVKRFFFPVVFFPVSLIANIFERVLFFMPYAYNYAIQLCHIILMAAGGIMISRMCRANGAGKALFLAGYTMTYPFLVFSIVIDKYIFSTFCVIVLIYICVFELKGKFAAGQAAAGVMTTNLYFFPYLTYDRDIKKWCINILKYALAFIGICILCAELPSLISSVKNVFINLDEYGGEGVSRADIALQYFNFIGSCFTKPEVAIAMGPKNYMRHDLAQPAGINPVGAVLLVLSVAGFILNRKSRFAQLSFAWVILSFVLFFVLGWQSAKNEMFISSFYFGWAFYALVFMLLEKIPDKLKIAKYAGYSACVAVLAVINIMGIIDLVNYGIQYYPA